MNWFTVPAFVVAGVLAALVLWPSGDDMGKAATTTGPSTGPSAAIPLAVMGDSNSHSYQDRISFPPGSHLRGGPWQPQTFQWTEVLARLRGTELDSGPWVSWGRPGAIAWARELIGLSGGRAPKKEDYLFNFANSGAACKNLMGDQLGQRFRQAPRLVSLMDKEPDKWKRGVVVIAVGANDWNGVLDVQARDPDAPELKAVTDYCVGQIRAAIALIHATHPSTRILIAGVVNEADDPSNFDRFKSAREMANIDRALQGFNGALASLATADPARIAFIDPRPWWEERWGKRGPNGEPDYRSVTIGSLAVTNTAGDSPNNLLLGDHHAGLVWNALWAQALSKRLREAFDLPVTPITDEEIRRFVEAQVSAGPKVRSPGS